MHNMQQMIATQIPAGTVIDDGYGNHVEVLRFHRGAPKSRIVMEIRRKDGRVAMGSVDDLTRFRVIELPPVPPL
jgi:hypothetical protein